MIIDLLKEAILSNIGHLKSAPKGWNKRNCPLCHTQGHGKDTRNRFGIQFNPTSIIANCFNCKFSTGYTEGKELSSSFGFLLTHLNIDKNFIDTIKFEIYKSRNQIKVVRDGDEIKPITDIKIQSLFEKWNPINLPENSLPISTWLENGLDDHDFLNVANYAINRGLFDLDQFYWSPEKSENMNKRLIIPYYYRNKIVGYTARLNYDTNDKSIPKYMQKCPNGFVYNLDNHVDWSRKYVLVNEGVLDAWITDGISTLGEINQDQIDIINRLQKEVIVIPDGDRSGHGLVKAAIDNNWAVSFPKWKKLFKDANQASQKYGKLLTTHSIISSAINGKDKIQIAWQLDQNERDKIKKYE